MHHRCPDGSVSSDERLVVSPHFAWPGSICVLALCSLLFLFSPSRAVADFSGLVVSVLDGDTLEVLHNNRPERIRLSGIDCPEKGQAYGTRAKQAASELVLGGEVTLQTYGHDKYGRTLADVLLPDSTNVNHTLVEDGWCWWYRKYAPGSRMLERLEIEAREVRIPGVLRKARVPTRWDATWIFSAHLPYASFASLLCGRARARNPRRRSIARDRRTGQAGAVAPAPHAVPWGYRTDLRAGRSREGAPWWR